MRDFMALMGLVTSGGLVLTMWTLAIAIKDYRVLRRLHVNGRRRLFARMQIRHESFRFVKHSLLVFVMLIAVYNRSIDLIWARNLCVILVSMLLSINSVLDLVGRYRAISMVAKYRRAEERLYER